MSKFLKLSFLIVASFLTISCSSDDDCTELANVPIFDSNLGEFVDNFIEVPCGSGGPVDE